MISQSRVPGEVYSHLALIQHPVRPTLPSTHVDGKLSAHPDQLGGICFDLSDAACMRLLDMDRLSSKLVNDAKVIGKHVRMLIIFGRYVLLYGLREGHGMGATKRKGENVSIRMLFRRQVSLQDILTMP